MRWTMCREISDLLAAEQAAEVPDEYQYRGPLRP